MPLKSFQNDSRLDNLLSYIGTDRVMQTQMRKMSDAQDQADDDQNAREMALLKASPEFKKMKVQMKVRRNGVSYPASDEYILDQLMRRESARKMREQRESQQTEEEE